MHPLLSALRASTPAFGAWLALPSAHTARLIAQQPRISWVCIDCEHGLTNLSLGVHDTITAIRASTPNPPSVLVRVPAIGKGQGVGWQIKYALDAGAQGIVVPMVDDADAAAQVALDSRFPPSGRRGFGSPFSHQQWGVSVSDYLVGGKANDEVIVCVQIENQSAVDNLEAIAQTEGVDVLFIGPFDLSLALGRPPPNPDPHPDVESVIQRIKDVAHKYGKKVAYYCTSGDRALQRAQEGFDIINVTNDVGALTDGISRHLALAHGDGEVTGGGKKDDY